MSPRGLPDVTADILSALRDHGPLVALLESSEAIYEGHPTEDHDFSASVVITPISDIDPPRRGLTERTYRFQVTITTTRSWREWFDAREDQPTGLSQMYTILERVDDRMRTAAWTPGGEISLGSQSGVAPDPMSDGRMAITHDWRYAGFY